MLKEEKAKADRAIQELSDQKELQLRETEILPIQLEASESVARNEAPAELADAKPSASEASETPRDNNVQVPDPSDLGGALVQAAVSSSTLSEHDSKLREMERVRSFSSIHIFSMFFLPFDYDVGIEA